MRWLMLACGTVALIATMAVSCGGSHGATDCGGLGIVCCDGRMCSHGTCIGDSPGVCADCGGPGQVCCDLGTCDSGGCCVDNICTGSGSTCPVVGGTCQNASCGNGTCGAMGQACCMGPRGEPTCTAGSVACVTGTCDVCGGAGQPCCAREGCGPDLVCDNAVCRACGGPGEPCCAGATCTSGCCDQGSDVCVADNSACPTGGMCTNNTCVCSGGDLNCGMGCRDSTSNVNQCGACNTQCTATEFCSDSMCKCRPGLVQGPGTECIDPKSDATACGTPPVACSGNTPVCSNGTCSAACAAQQQRCGNACVDTQTNPLHCGDCQTACRNDEVCVAGNCQRFDAGVGCTTCPCAACGGGGGGGTTCCGYPNDPTFIVCVRGGACPTNF